MPSIEQMLKRQKDLAKFGEHTLRSDDLDDVLQEVCRLVAEALGTQRAKVLEIQGGVYFVRAGVGWSEGIVGKLRVPVSEHSSEGFSLKSGGPVITRDISKEHRFDVPAFMKANGVVALVNVPIFLPGGQPFGLLQVDDVVPRDFCEGDTEFLQTYASILGPVIDRLRKASSLRMAEHLFSLVVERAQTYAIFNTDEHDRIRDWYPGAHAVFGWTAEEVQGRSAEILFTEEDRAAGVPAKEAEQAARNGFAPDVRWHLRRDGSRVFIHGSSVALRDNNGNLQGFMKIGQDVTQQKMAEARLQVLVDELQHRGRNLLGIISSIANKTFEPSPSLKAFQDRIFAISRAQGLLGKSKMEAVPLADLVRTELAAHVDLGSPKLVIDGPPCQLGHSQVQNVALALHELATNAVKYGALKGEAGRVEVRWNIDSAHGARLLRLAWRESGVVIPGAAQSRRGYGRELIENALGYATGAITHYELGSGGVHCRIQMPLEDKDGGDVALGL